MANAGGVSCRFFRYGCSEEDHPLFQRAYTRSNRMRGTKIMRCFPHCCPDHMPRRYCGCSIHVLVTFPCELERLREEELVVCARFEASVSSGRSVITSRTASLRGRSDEEAVLLPVGQHVRLPNYLFDPSDESEGDQTWVRAIKESEAKQLEAPQNSIIYSINKRTFPKWIYNYESGATKRQREMQHHFRVYVLALEPGRSLPSTRPVLQDHSHVATVIGHHASPGFTLISYRRASTLQGRLDDSVVETPTSTEEDPNASESKQEGETHARAAADMIDETTGGMAVDAATASSVEDDGASAEPLTTEPSNLPESFTHQVSVNDVSFPWEAAERQLRHEHSGVKEKLQHLRILYLFLRSLPMQEFGFCITSLTNTIRQRWLGPMFVGAPTSLRDRYVSTFSLATVMHCIGPQDCVGLSVPCQPVLETCIAALLPVFECSSMLRSLLPTSNDSQSNEALPRRDHPDKNQLFEGLSHYIHQVYDVVSHTLDQAQEITSISELVDEVMSVIYRERSLEPLRRPVMEILRDDDAEATISELLRRFTAQANEEFIARSGASNILQGGVGHELATQAHTIDRDSEDSEDWRSWSGRWVVNTDSIRCAPSYQHSASGRATSLGFGPDAITMVDALAWVHQLSVVDVNVTEGWCSVQSAISASLSSLCASAAMGLVLDGRSRVFRIFPNGLASMITLAAENDWVWGDYAGTMTGGKAASILLVLFSFRTPATGEYLQPLATRVRRIALSITSETGRETAQAQVTAEIDTADYVPSAMDEVPLAQQLCSARQALFAELRWTPVCRLKAAYEKVQVP